MLLKNNKSEHLISKRFGYIFLLVLAITTTNNANAILFNEKTIPKIVSAGFNGKSKIERIDEAKIILNSLNELQSRLPALSKISSNNLGKQKDFIDNFKYHSYRDKGKGDEAFKEWMKNITSYHNNPEHYLYELNEGIDNTRNSLNHITQSNNTHREMYWWVMTSTLLLHSTIWETNINRLIITKQMKNIELIKNGGKLYKLDSLHRIYRGIGINILLKITMPYLAEQSNLKN